MQKVFTKRLTLKVHFILTKNVKSSWKRSNPIINVSRQDIERLEFFTSLQILDLEIINSGLRNTNYLITTLSELYILKIYPDETHGMIETQALKLTKDALPVPEIYETGTLSVFSKSYYYIIMQCVEGDTMAQLLSDGEDLPASLFNSIGRLLANLQSFTFEKAGFFDSSLNIENEINNTPLGYFQLFEQLVARTTVKQNLNGLYHDILDVIALHQSKMNGIDQQPRLVHGDFNPENILIDNVSKEITGLIDWEFAISLNPMMDLGNFLRFYNDLDHHHVQTIVTSFSENGGVLPNDWQIVVRMYDLLTLASILDRKKVDRNRHEDILSRIRHYLDELG